MSLLGPLAYHLSLLETDLRKAGDRPFHPDYLDAHILNALLFVRRRAIERLADDVRTAGRKVAEIAADGIEGAYLEEARQAAIAELEELREGLEGAKPSEHAEARGVRVW